MPHENCEQSLINGKYYRLVVDMFRVFIEVTFLRTGQKLLIPFNESGRPVTFLIDLIKATNDDVILETVANLYRGPHEVEIILAVVKQIENQRILKKIFEMTNHLPVKIQCIDKITSQEWLKHAAMISESCTVREKIYERIDDEDFLTEKALNDVPSAAYSAMQNIKNIENLIKLVVTAKYREIKNMAIRRLLELRRKDV